MNIAHKSTRKLDAIAELRRLTVAEYHRMGELGIIDPDERVELIEGQIFQKPVKGTAHSAAVKRVEKLLESRLGARALVRLQDPVRLNDYSEPEPDIAVVKPDPLYYEDRHPTVGEIDFIIEVADTTLNRDKNFKAKAYARSGIADYWVLDVKNRKLYVFRDPSQEGYRSEVVLADDDSIAAVAFPEVIIPVGEMLRPALPNKIK